mgnify:CR=1 FL=1
MNNIEKIKGLVKEIQNLFFKNNYSAVINETKKAIKVYPDISVFYNMMGLAFSKISKFDEAKIVLEKGYKVNSNDLAIINNLANVYKSVLDTWRENGIAQEFSYKRDTFLVEKIQENLDLVQTKLTNYDFDGNYLQDFNCTYIIRKEDDDWLISLATSSNKSNTSFK